MAVTHLVATGGPAGVLRDFKVTGTTYDPDDGGVERHKQVETG